MTIEIIDTLEVAKREKKRKIVMNTRKLHAWVHYYPTPGDHDDMHCHNADQTFYVIEGECTMRFPDGGAAVLTPGKAALIHGGEFYQLENTGGGPMIMMGTRSGSQDDIKHINYETRQDLRAEGVERMHRRT
jgi:mannose-6-phosphate isomerase-like protein (cupin superfamily)